MQWFYRSANHWVGTGLGTNKFLVPHLQMQHGVVRQGGFVHMHNEYLQCLLELGGIGLALGVAAGIEIMHAFWRKRAIHLLLASTAIAVTALGNSVLHLAPIAFFTAVILSEYVALKKE